MVDIDRAVATILTARLAEALGARAQRVASINVAPWLDCTFETALERALRRGQEGLRLGETIRAYPAIYCPAQRIHFARDCAQ